MERPSQEILDRWHKDPNNWKWGFIYYNPKDPRIMVPKKIQWMGFTMNFANSKAIIFSLLFFVFAFLAGAFWGNR